MEIKYFRLIKTIAEEGNIVNSSEKLFLTQSALSHQLIVLEERLGFKVFNRSRNNWVLTQEGKALYQLSTDVLSKIEDGLDTVRKLRDGTSGKIRLGTECYFYYQGLPAFIQKMGLLYPEMEIELSGASGDTFEQLISKKIDVTLVTHKPSDSNLACNSIFEDEILCLMHKEHPLAEKTFLEPTDFATVPLIVLSLPLSTVSVYKRFMEPHGVTPLTVREGVQMGICIEMIEANMGVMCIPQWGIKPFKTSGNLIFKKIGEKGLYRKHYLVYRKGERNKKFMDDFINAFEEDFSSKR